MKRSYSVYGRKEGFKPLKGYEAVFEKLSEELFDVNSRLRYLAFYDPEELYEQTLHEKEAIMAQLRAISKGR